MYECISYETGKVVTVNSFFNCDLAMFVGQVTLSMLTFISICLIIIWAIWVTRKCMNKK